MSATERPLYALALRLAGIALIATLYMLVKVAGETGVALPEIMFWRQALSLPLIIAALALTGELGKLRTNRIGTHALRSTLGMLGMLCNFGAAVLLPLAEATTLTFTTPLFAVILGAFVLREKIGPWRWAAVVIGFAGVLVVAQPGHAPIDPLGAAAGLGAGLIVAMVAFQIRDLGRTDAPTAVVFYFALFGALIMLPLLPFTMTAHTPMQWLILVAMGTVGTLGQLLLTAALKHGAVASVIVMDYTALIWATLFGWTLWDQLPTLATWLGAPLIVAAGLIVMWRERCHAQRPDAPLTPAATVEVD